MRRRLTIKSTVFLACLLLPIITVKASPELCSVPPFSYLGTKPNVLIVMDFSGSMQFPAYFACAGWAGYWDSKVADCYYYDPHYAYADYASGEDYYGIFDPDKYYKYDRANGYFVDNTSNCNYTDRIGSQPDCISGNLLNFVTTSRIDAALKALIGGKADCDDNYCYIKAQGSRRGLRVSNIHCEFYIRPEDYRDGSYPDKEILLDAYDYDGACPLSGLSDAHVVLKTPKENRKGVIQRTFDKVRYAFMVYASNGRYGEVRYGFHENNIDALVERIQTEVPYYGTPTGEALWEAHDYMVQSNEHDYERNSSYISKGSEKDPYYDLVDGETKARICRKSSIILISDGEWNGDVDPVEPAKNLWFNDIREDLESKQNVKLYTLFAFSSSEEGKNSMKTVALFGSFKELENCIDDWPYTFNDYPDSSLDVIYPRLQCDPDGTYNDCCHEWDRNEDGIPDTFFYASNGKELEEALSRAIGEIVGSAQSAGAVATVTQEVVGEDIVIRGAFTTYEPEDPSTYVWKGHLEVYQPYEGCGEFTTEGSCNETVGCSWVNGKCVGKIYSFQLPENEGKFCSDPNFKGGHCWDAGESLKSQGAREIFTFLDGSKVNLDDVDPGRFTLDDESDFNGDGNVDVADVVKLKNWIKGTTDGDGVHMRNREGWILGDIVYSTPVVVGTPSPASVPQQVARENCGCSCNDDECMRRCFYCYRYRNLHRDRVVYVGANDGMLHAFLVGEWDRNNNIWVYEAGKDPDSDGHKIGEELWAYVPSNLLSELKCLAKPSYGTENGCQHRTMVDLAPEVWDVYIDCDGDGAREWRTILIGGERGGGDVYFAIDVTDPYNPEVLWEFSVLRNMAGIYNDNGSYQISLPYLNKEIYEQIKTLAASWSKPYVGRLKIPDGVCFPSIGNVPPSGQISANWRCYVGNDLSGWFAFIGGGARVFNNSGELISGDNGTAFYPYLLVVDVESGVNIFQYIWPLLRNQVITDIPRNVENYVPYVMADTVVLDITNDNGHMGIPDGFVDHVYIGDLNGYFYGIKFQGNSTSGLPLRMDVWRTKEVNGGSSNVYRSDYQPISVQPTAVLDPDRDLWLYFGTGKYDDVTGSNDDKTDTASMSFYALVDAANVADSAISSCEISGDKPECSISGEIVHNHFAECEFPDNSWIREENKCFTCLLDFTIPGERVIDSALVAGGLVFVTTFVPSLDPCEAGGESYIYVFDYMCRPLEYNPLEYSGLRDVEYLDLQGDWKPASQQQEGEKAKAYRAKLGVGMPSHPVLDSSGEYVLIQTSDAKIHRVRVKLLMKPLYLKGWKAE